MLLLKSYQKLGCFPDLFEVPIPVVEHIRGLLELGSGIEAAVESKQTGKRYRAWVRQRVDVRLDPAAARSLAERVIRQAALSKDNPADLISVALEELVRARLELPGYTTLDLWPRSRRTSPAALAASASGSSTSPHQRRTRTGSRCRPRRTTTGRFRRRRRDEAGRVYFR